MFKKKELLDIDGVDNKTVFEFCVLVKNKTSWLRNLLKHIYKEYLCFKHTKVCFRSYSKTNSVAFTSFTGFYLAV